MIDPSQLRIGSRIYWKGKNEVAIEASDFAELEHDENYFDVGDPIPLTDEVLRRTNFKETLNSFFEFKLKQRGVIFYYEDSVRLSYGDYVEESGLLPHIDSLHLLQNLVADLSGIELEIK